MVENLFKKYKKKPQVVEGCHLTKDNIQEVHKYINNNGGKATLVTPVNEVSSVAPHILIETLEGKMKSELDSYVMKGIKGEYWSIKNDIFKETYDEYLEEDIDESGD